MFLIDISYTRPIEEIEARTVEHRAWLDVQIAAGHLILAGPKVPRTGGVLIGRGGTKDEMIALLAQDPFQLAGLVKVEITEFVGGRFHPALADLV